MRGSIFGRNRMPQRPSPSQTGKKKAGTGLCHAAHTHHHRPHADASAGAPATCESRKSPMSMFYAVRSQVQGGRGVGVENRDRPRGGGSNAPFHGGGQSLPHCPTGAGSVRAPAVVRTSSGNPIEY